MQASPTALVDGELADACLVGPPAGSAAAERSDRVEGALTAAGFTVRRTEAVSAADVARTFDRLSDRRCALVLSVTDELGPALAAAAGDHPDVPVAATGLAAGTDLAPNVAALRFDRTGAAFAAGYLAARTTATGQVAAIGLRADADSPALIASFAAGVRHGATGPVRTRGTKPPRLVADAVGAKRRLARWSERGTDVAFAASAGLGQAVAATAMSTVGLGADRVAGALGWIVEDPAVPAVEIAQQVADGRFAAAPIVGSLADGAVRLELGDVPVATRNAVDALALDISAGRIAVG